MRWNDTFKANEWKKCRKFDKEKHSQQQRRYIRIDYVCSVVRTEYMWSIHSQMQENECSTTQPNIRYFK